MFKKRSWIFDLVLVLMVTTLAVVLIVDDESSPKPPLNPFQTYPFADLQSILFPGRPYTIETGPAGHDSILKINPNETIPLPLSKLQAYLDAFLILPEFEVFDLAESEASYGFQSSPQIQFQFPNQTLDLKLGEPNPLLNGMSYILLNGKAGLLPEVLVAKMRPGLANFLPSTLKAYMKLPQLPDQLRNSLGRKLLRAPQNTSKISSILNSEGSVIDKIPSHMKVSGFSLEITWENISQMLTGLIDENGFTYLEIRSGHWLKSRQALLE